MTNEPTLRGQSIQDLQASFQYVKPQPIEIPIEFKDDGLRAFLKTQPIVQNPKGITMKKNDDGSITMEIDASLVDVTITMPLPPFHALKRRRWKPERRQKAWRRRTARVRAQIAQAHKSDDRYDQSLEDSLRARGYLTREQRTAYRLGLAS